MRCLLAHSAAHTNFDFDVDLSSVDTGGLDTHHIDRPVEWLIECVGRCADDEADVISFNIVLKGTI